MRLQSMGEGFPQTARLSRRAFFALAGEALALAGCTNKKQATSGSQAIQMLEMGAGVRSLEDILASTTLRVGMVPDSSPLCLIDGRGNYNGLERNLVGYVCGVVGLNCEVVPMDIVDTYDFLASGRIDIACAAASIDDKRSNEATYSFPYAQLQLGVLTSVAHPLASVDDLSLQVVLACEESYAAFWARTYLSNVELHTYETYTNLYQALEAGRGDAILADELVLQAYAVANPSYMVCLRMLGELRPLSLAAAAQNADLIEYLQHDLRNYILYKKMQDAYEEFVVTKAGDGYAAMLLPAPENV